MRALPYLCLALMSALWPLQGRADATVDPLVGDRPLSEFVSSKAYLEELKRYLTGYETWVGPCPDPQVADRLRTLVLQKTVSFPGVVSPVEAQWIEVVRIAGCANDYERPVYVTRDRGKTVFYAHLLGTTRTEPRLQHRVLNSLVASEKTAAIAAGCPQTQPVRVITTAYVSEFSTEYGKAWRETWTLANCRGLKKLTIDFKPDHAGSITIRFSG